MQEKDMSQGSGENRPDVRLSDQLRAYAMGVSDLSYVVGLQNSRANVTTGGTSAAREPMEGEDPRTLTLNLDPTSAQGSQGIGQEQLHRAAGNRVLIRLTGDSVDAAVIASLEPLLNASSAVRIFLDLPVESPTKPGVIADVLDGLEVRGFRLFTIDDDSGTWQTVRNKNGLGLRVDPPPLSILYAIKSAGLLVVSAALHSSDLGGAERAHLDLMRGLQAGGHLVHSLLPDRPGPLVEWLRDCGGSVGFHHSSWWVTTAPGEDWELAAVGMERIVAEIAAIGPDVVLTETGVLVAAALAAKALRLPHVWYLHETLDSRYGIVPPIDDARQIGDAIRDLSDAIVVNSDFVRGHFLGDGEATVLAPITSAKLDRVPTVPQRPVSSWTLGIFGLVSEAKGQFDSIRAVRILRDSGVDVVLNVYGAGTPDNLERMRAVAVENEVEEFVNECGFVDDPEAAMAQCDIIVAPSWGEGFGRVPVEAIRAGRPVVYAHSGGMAEYMTDGVTGVAVRLQDSESIATAIRCLIDDDDLRASLVTGAPAVVEGWLSDHGVVEGMETVLRAVTARRSEADSWSEWANRRLTSTWVSQLMKERDEGLALVRGLEGELRVSRARVAKLRAVVDGLTGDLAEIRGSRGFRVVQAVRHPVRVASRLVGSSRSS